MTSSVRRRAAPLKKLNAPTDETSARAMTNFIVANLRFWGGGESSNARARAFFSHTLKFSCVDPMFFLRAFPTDSECFERGARDRRRRAVPSPALNRPLWETRGFSLSSPGFSSRLDLLVRAFTTAARGRHSGPRLHTTPTLNLLHRNTVTARQSREMIELDFLKLASVASVVLTL